MRDQSPRNVSRRLRIAGEGVRQRHVGCIGNLLRAVRPTISSVRAAGEPPRKTAADTAGGVLAVCGALLMVAHAWRTS